MGSKFGLCEVQHERQLQNNIRLHIIPHIGNIKLQKLGALDTQRLLIRLEEKNLSPRTCQYIFSILRKALNQAVKWNMINYNPSDGVDHPRVPSMIFDR